MTSQLKDHLDKIPKALPDGKTNGEGKTWSRIIAERMVLEAAKGNIPALKEVLDRVEGKVKAQSEHSGDGFKLILGVKPPIQIVSFATVQAEIEAENKRLAGAG